MPNRNSDILFQLIHSLEKSEKRNFKLYIKRNSANTDLKIIELFDAIEKLNDYDEAVLLKKLTSIKKQQLSNTRTHLYKQLLASLRLIRSSDSIDLQLHEQLDYARILYNKGLYLQSLRILDKVKELAIHYNQDTFLIQVISLEKKIETLHITRSLHNRADQLSAEAVAINDKRRMITILSNLALNLYSWYITNGHARNEKDEEAIKKYFREHLPDGSFQLAGFYEQLYNYQSYCWYAFIRQDFLQYYRYTQKWVNLFGDNKLMIEVETGHYIKGMHNLLNAHFILRNHKKFEITLGEFEKFSKSAPALAQDGNRIQLFVYLNSARINQHIMQGTFMGGLALVPYIKQGLGEYALYLDTHRVLVFNYKIATLYFGAGNYEVCIDYLRKIINDNVDLRIDLQCYARLLHLIAHYELGNYELMDHLIRSVYRFMSKMENFTAVEEMIFRFLRKSFNIPPKKLKVELKKLLENIREVEHIRYETRSFAYLDIISWLESKLYGKSMSNVLSEKYLQSSRN